MQTGSREFAAYARTLRRLHMARLLERSAEAMQTPQRRLDFYDILFGDVTIAPQLLDERVADPSRSR